MQQFFGQIEASGEKIVQKREAVQNGIAEQDGFMSFAANS